MSDNFQAIPHDLWVEARTMTLSLAQVAGSPSTLRLTWTLPTPSSTEYAGAVVLLSETPFDASNSPEDGKRYVPSSNFAVPADIINGAKVVGAYYGYFGDSISTTSLDVSNTDPTKVYYAAIFACSNILQYYPSGILSYAIDTSRFNAASETWAGTIPRASHPPENPANGQVYFDEVENKVLIWNVDMAAWLETSDKTVAVGTREPIQENQVFVNTSTTSLRFFISGMWVDCTADNTRVKFGSGWVALGAVSISPTLPTDRVNGDICIVTDQQLVGINASSQSVKVFTLGQWLTLSPNLIQFQTAPDVWTTAVAGDSLVGPIDPVIPEIGDFFYKSGTRDLLAWSGNAWVKADTAQEGVAPQQKMGVGDDGSFAARLDLIKTMKTLMGWPAVCIELNEEHFNVAVDNALQQFRMRADNAYAHRYAMFTLVPNQQVYYLNDPRTKTDRIVNILKIGRAQALGNGMQQDPVYGQLFVPNVYQGGGMVDLVSIHLMNQLAETFERIFAANLMYDWDEPTRTLTIHRQIRQPERVVLEAVLERPEQELINDRYVNQWIQGWAMAELKEMLGLVRTKYSSIAGPNGGVTMNGDTLLAQAATDYAELQRQINDYEVGNGGTTMVNASFYIM